MNTVADDLTLRWSYIKMLKDLLELLIKSYDDKLEKKSSFSQSWLKSTEKSRNILLT